jgi:hypothetical protein
MNYELKNTRIVDMTEDFNSEETIYLIESDVYFKDAKLCEVHEYVEEQYFWREGMGYDYQGWEVDTGPDCAINIQNQFERLDEKHEDISEHVVALLQNEVDKKLNVGYLDLGGGWPGSQVVAKNISNFEFKPGMESGVGLYEANLKIMALRRRVWNSPPELSQNIAPTSTGGMTWTVPRF